MQRAATRRSVLLGLLAGVGLVGCGGGGASDQAAARPIQLWHLFEGADGKVMTAMLDQVVARTSPVQATCFAWGAPYYTKLAMASAGGRPPDLAVMHASRLNGYAPGGLLQPYDMGVLARAGITEASFAPAVWERCRYQDELYALPLDTHPFVTFTNLDIAAKAGILGTDGQPAPITSQEQFVAVGRKLAEVTGGLGIAYGFLLDTAQAWRLFWGLYGQTGGEYDFAGPKARWDDAQAIRVVTFLASLFADGVLSRNLDYDGSVSAFTTGRAGMILSGEWEGASFVKSVKNLGAAPMPTLFDRPAGYADSHTFVLPRRELADPAAVERRVRAVAVAAGLVQEGLRWAGGGHIPAYLPIVADPRYGQLKPQSSYAQAAQSVFLDPPVPFAGPGTEFQKRMSAQLTRGFLGTDTPQATVAGMLAVVDDLLSIPRPA